MARRALLCLGALASLASLAGAQISTPVASDDVFDVGANKFLTRSAQDSKSSPSPGDEDPDRSSQCPVDLEVLWQSAVGSSVYSTPLVTDLYSDGRPDVVVPSFVHEVDVLEGPTGAQSIGWPVNHRSTLHASPVMADCDFDGVLDIVVVTYSAEIVCYSDNGGKVLHFQIPGLEVRKDWYVGLSADHVDHDHPDVSDEVADETQPLRDLLPHSRRSLLQENVRENVLSPEAEESFGILGGDDEFDFASDADDDDDPKDFDLRNYDEGYEDYGDENDPLLAPGGAAMDYEEHWDDDEYYDGHFHHHPEGRVEDYISVDPHVLCTPTVADVDGDGFPDLIVAVSYLFDHETYAGASNRREELGDDVDISNYLAGGVLAFDFVTMDVKWHTHLDLSTHHVNFQAYMYSSPTVADLDADGNPEIIVGTSVGFVYVLDQNGTSVPGWPIQMGEVQAQVVAEDVNDDGVLEIVACDSRGSVAAFSTKGREIWERHLGALIANAAVVGDINGDGRTEVVVGTGSGNVVALDGATGRTVLSHQANAMVMSSVALARLHPQGQTEGLGLHLVTMAFDGFLYLIDGKTGCADVVDVGETSYGTVLVQDLDADGLLEILVTTMNGNVVCFKSRAPKGRGPIDWEREGVRIEPVAGDISGKSRAYAVEIVDRQGLSGPYEVTLKIVGVGIEAMNAGKNPVVGVSNTFSSPGTYALEIPCPKSRTTGVVMVEMRDKNGKVFRDEFSAHFNMSYYRILKWILALPVVVGSVVVLGLF